MPQSVAAVASVMKLFCSSDTTDMFAVVFAKRADLNIQQKRADKPGNKTQSSAENNHTQFRSKRCHRNNEAAVYSINSSQSMKGHI